MATIFEKGNIGSLQTKLEQMLKNNNLEISKEEISNYILNKYNWDDVTKKTLGIYSEIVNKRLK